MSDSTKKSLITILLIVSLLLNLILYKAYFFDVKALDRAMFDGLMAVNDQLNGTSLLLEHAYDGSDTDRKLFQIAVRNIYEPTNSQSSSISSAYNSNTKKYENCDVTFLWAYLGDVFSETDRIQFLTQERIDDFYNSITKVCDEWDTFPWDEVKYEGRYDFKKDPNNLKEHLANMKELVQQERDLLFG